MVRASRNTSWCVAHIHDGPSPSGCSAVRWPGKLHCQWEGGRAWDNLPRSRFMPMSQASLSTGLAGKEAPVMDTFGLHRMPSGGRAGSSVMMQTTGKMEEQCCHLPAAGSRARVSQAARGRRGAGVVHGPGAHVECRRESMSSRRSLQSLTCGQVGGQCEGQRRVLWYQGFCMCHGWRDANESRRIESHWHSFQEVDLHGIGHLGRSGRQGCQGRSRLALDTGFQGQLHAFGRRCERLERRAVLHCVEGTIIN